MQLNYSVIVSSIFHSLNLQTSHIEHQDKINKAFKQNTDTLVDIHTVMNTSDRTTFLITTITFKI